MKKVYLLVANNGDGSYSIEYITDRKNLEYMEKLYQKDQLDELTPGCDGDGISYEVLKVDDDFEENNNIVPLTKEYIDQYYNLAYKKCKSSI